MPAGEAVSGAGRQYVTAGAQTMADWITSVADWQAFVQESATTRVLAMAFCPTGPDPHQDAIETVQVANSARAAGLDVAALGGPQELARLLRPLLASTDWVKAFHNAKAAIRYLLPLGLVPVRIFDAMLAEQLLSDGDMNREPTLGETTQRILGVELFAAPFGEARAIYSLRRKLVPLLVQADLVRCAQIEFECAVPTAAMELAGLRLDVPRLQALIGRGIKRMDETTNQFVKAFDSDQSDLFGGGLLNLHSDAQVLAFLKDHGVPVQRVNRSALQPLLGRFPALQHLLDYRQAAGDRALESYIQAIHPATGRIHPTYSQLAAATGRFGCSNPNTQSFPRTPEHRACVIAAPGHMLVVADYSQIELRIVAQISQDRRMLAGFQSGGDLHALTAGILADKPASEVTRAERQAAKAVNFGLIYSMGARGLAAYAQQTYGVQMTLAQAESFRRRFFSAYAGVAAWHERQRQGKPTVVRTLSGRRRSVPPGALAQALNSPVQGTGADILKRALVLLSPALRLLGAHIVGIVHDEVLVETPLTQAEATREVVETAMEQAALEFLPDVPCPVTARIAPDWAEAS